MSSYVLYICLHALIVKRENSQRQKKAPSEKLMGERAEENFMWETILRFKPQCWPQA